MRIGVLTYHCQPNYGAQLQAVSTVGFLQQQGHSVFVLNWYAPDLEGMYARRIPEQQIICHQQFTEHSLPVTAKCQTIEQLAECIDQLQLDGIIVGSDALFKFIPARTYRYFSLRKLRFINKFTPLSCELLDNNPFFGGFIHKLKRKVPVAVYAASSQNCQYQQMNFIERFKMRNALANYRFISTRDKWTQQMVCAITHRTDVPVYPDPVFAFSSNANISIPSKEDILRRYRLSEDYVLLSFRCRLCQPKLVSELANAACRHGLEPVSLPMPEGDRDFGIPHSIPLPLSPIDWYALIIHSRGYIGERMHPIVVCLHNAVPFFSFDEYGTDRQQPDGTMAYHPSSSKTYQIVDNASLLDFLYSYRGTAPLPDAEAVICRLLSFPTEQCRNFASSMAQQYREGMTAVLNSLKANIIR